MLGLGDPESAGVTSSWSSRSGETGDSIRVSSPKIQQPVPARGRSPARRTRGLPLLALLLPALMLISNGGAGAIDTAEPLVRYDAATDRLTVQARQVSLEEILDLLNRDTPLRVHRGHPSRYQAAVSVEFQDLSLEEGLDRLLLDFGWVLIRAPGGGTAEAANAGAGTLIVLSKSRSPRRHRASVPESTASTEALARIDRRGHTDVAEALLRDRRLLNLILELPEAERRWIASSLRESLETRRFATFGGAMKLLDALYALNPESAIHSMETLATYGDQHQRRVAARGLSRIGGESAVPLLAGVLLRDDRTTSQAAANRLARIGGADANTILVSQYQSGASERQWAVVWAVAHHGDDAARTAIAEQILQTVLPEDVSANDVINSYLDQNETAM